MSLACHPVGGHILLRDGTPGPEHTAFAVGLAADPDHTVVICDLAEEYPEEAWEPVVRALAATAGKLRLVPWRPHPGGLLPVGELLGQRLARVVIAADGHPVTSAGGGLFVPPDAGTGWYRVGPGRLPRRDSRRFPKPKWTAWAPLEDMVALTPATTLRPLPSGAWLSPESAVPAPASHGERDHGQWLYLNVAWSHDTINVILGQPGAPPVPAADVAKLWSMLPVKARQRVQFVPYGTSGPSRQELADALGDRVTMAAALAGAAATEQSAAGPAVARPAFTRTATVNGKAPVNGEASRSASAPVPPARPERQRLPAIRLESGQPARGLRRPVPAAPGGFTGDAATPPRVAVDPPEKPAAPAPVSLSVSASSATEVLPTTATFDVEPTTVAPAEAEPAAEPAEPEPAEPEPAETEPAEPEPAAAVLEGDDPAGDDPAEAEPAAIEPAEAVLAETVLAGDDPAEAELAEAELAAIEPAEAVLAEDDPAEDDPAAIEPVEDKPAEAQLAVIDPAVGPQETAVAPAAAPPETGAVRVQPVPAQDASAMYLSGDIEEERQWLQRSLSRKFSATASSVARVLSQNPRLRGGGEQEVVVDLVAVRLYLTEYGQRIDDSVRTGQPGSHVPFARCVSAGLRRLLPSHRGAARLRATLTDAEWSWYSRQQLVTEWAFCSALTDGTVKLPGNVDFLIWSATARRTSALAPELPGQVLFLPGTLFKVLEVRDGPRREVLLREMPTRETAPGEPLGVERAPLDEIALTGLGKSNVAWLGMKQVAELPQEHAQRFGHPPGLIRNPAGSPIT